MTEETRGGEEPGAWKVTDQKWQGRVEVGEEVAADFIPVILSHGGVIDSEGPEAD